MNVMPMWNLYTYCGVMGSFQAGLADIFEERRSYLFLDFSFLPKSEWSTALSLRDTHDMKYE